MTCIVGMVDGKDVIVGGDSAGVAGWSLHIRADSKVFVSHGFIYGFTSSFRMGQLLRYKFIPPEMKGTNLDEYMRTAWIDAVRRCLADGGFAKKENGVETGGTFLVGHKGRLFCVYEDFQVAECSDEYAAVGCGTDIASGAMFAMKEMRKTAHWKITKALEAAVNHSAGVRGPFEVVVLKG